EGVRSVTLRLHGMPPSFAGIRVGDFSFLGDAPYPAGQFRASSLCRPSSSFYSSDLHQTPLPRMADNGFTSASAEPAAT
nr:hypothetical protein [Tanacetum cinerariifolium]